MTEKEQNTGHGEAWERHLYGCWLNSVPGIGKRTIEKLLSLCGSERQVYLQGKNAWRQILTARQLEQMIAFAEQNEPSQLYESFRKQGIQFVQRDEPDYPERLKKIPDPPYGLYVKGSLPQADKPSVAVVGARDCSDYGRFVAKEVGELLGANNIQVISGMARGIDGISQKAALIAGGSSCGVLGCGVDVCYPPSNRELYDMLCEKGGVLSAYPPGAEAKPGNFPPRNRIVSGLSDILIVVEARAKSGTLITVDMALEQGKDVYVVPGRITDRLSDGCNYLLKQGAEIFLSPEEFLNQVWERWQCDPVGRATSTETQILQWIPVGMADNLPPEFKEVYQVLSPDAATIASLFEKLSGKYTVPQLMTILMGLCTKGLVVQVTPGWFKLKVK